MKKIAAFIFCACAALSLGAQGKRIILFGGKSVHGYGAHENTLACELLKESFLEALPKGTAVELVKDPFPQDIEFFKGASLLVIISEGEGHHPLNGRETFLKEINAQGVGIALFHYALKFRNEADGALIREVIGGNYEPYFSVNPNWVAKIDRVAKHPATNGISPFTVDDEWYFNMRFRQGGVTRLLQAVPTDQAYLRPDGKHSGNRYVRALKGSHTTISWASENPNGTRGFGFSGWHHIWNYNMDSYRKFIVNALAWTAGFEVPENGFETRRPGIEEIDSRIPQDQKKPTDWERSLAVWVKKAEEWNR